jgi:hypothetical protein
VRASRVFLLAATIASLGLGARAAEDLGTLFFTPQERAALDRMRRGEPETPSVARMARHSVTGFVRRSDGRDTVWIDGAPIPFAGAPPEAILPPDAKRAPPAAGSAVRIERKPPR